ncbi:hypothetical protein [Amycolatopsis sp. lyj-23]|uniref:hypothetical protein n=1 Tax=Amycolatopsis sp. lyj-23 TaxID=2789283 RepID=UPI003979697E
MIPFHYERVLRHGVALVDCVDRSIHHAGLGIMRAVGGVNAFEPGERVRHPQSTERGAAQTGSISSGPGSTGIAFGLLHQSDQVDDVVV